MKFALEKVSILRGEKLMTCEAQCLTYSPERAIVWWKMCTFGTRKKSCCDENAINLLKKLLCLLKNFQFCFEISLDLLKNSIFFKVQIFFRNKVHWSIKIINRLLWKILLVTRKWYNYCWSRVIYLYWILSRVSYT